MQDLTRLNLLIDKAAAIYGSDNKLAEAMGTTRQTISNWRHGVKSPSTDAQERLAEVAGVDKGMTVAIAAVEKTGNADAMKWIAHLMARIKENGVALYLDTGFAGPTGPTEKRRGKTKCNHALGNRLPNTKHSANRFNRVSTLYE